MDKDIVHLFGPGGHKCPCCKKARKETRAARRAAKRRAIKEGTFDLKDQGTNN